jgi:NADPH:quinone reductase-like Zn-dependent oxidoreductase
MKAFQIHHYGPIESGTLEDLPTPSIGLADVLVRVEAASVNPLDVKLVSGILRDYYPLKMP